MKYLVAIHHPAHLEHIESDPATMKAIDDLNDEMVAAGKRVFVGGLRPPSQAKAIHFAPEGGLLVTDGPYLETKEAIGGFWVLEVADEAEAVEWGRKAAVACRTPVEVRPFF